MATTKIEWAERVWNPVTGCTPVSEGCANCYAKRQAKWLQGMKSPKYKHGFKPTFHLKALDEITPTQKPATIFVPSMSDLFQYDFTEYEPASMVINRMRLCSQHRFMLLTKRPERAAECLPYIYGHNPRNIPQNVALGVSAENQARLEERSPLLWQCPAAYHFLSIEPMLGPIDIKFVGQPDLIICGGESGPGARPVNPTWVRDLWNQCATFDIPFCFKQWGEWAPDCVCSRKRRCATTPRPRPGSRGIMFRCGKKEAGRKLPGPVGGEIHDGKINWRG